MFAAGVFGDLDRVALVDGRGRGAARPSRPAMRRSAPLAAGVAVLISAGCGSGEEQKVRESVRAFFATSPADCQAGSGRLRGNGRLCLREARALGDPAAVEPVDAVNEIAINGDRATARVVSAGQRLRGAAVAVREDDVWRFDGVDRAVP